MTEFVGRIVRCAASYEINKIRRKKYAILCRDRFDARPLQRCRVIVAVHSVHVSKPKKIRSTGKLGIYHAHTKMQTDT